MVSDFNPHIPLFPSRFFKRLHELIFQVCSSTLAKIDGKDFAPVRNKR